ncbi:MAG: hypothetical protein H6721_09245 [Sandaracinus sp.]|nr:hypothetical protein [Sandaracinus sp.]MCB9621804.1 hypothetical protein [Sandaracinus sp.]MCB9632302.1 hypothetical protein [Sandaracinus sp.]
MFFATLRLIVFAGLALGIAAFVIFKALAARRAGQKYRFGALDGGVLLGGREVDPRGMLVAASVYLVGIGALLAWPLGLYEALAERTSECRELLTDEELQALAPGFEPLRLHHLDTSCTASSWGPGIRGRYDATLDSGLGRNLDYEISIRPGQRSARGELVRVDRGHEVDLYLASGHGGARVTLSTEHFDEDAVATVARRLTERAPRLLVPFVEAERARYEGPSFVRRHAPWVFLGVVVFLLVAAVVVARVRQARAMRRALEE